MKGRQIRYSEDELRWIKAHCTDVRRDAHAKFVELFGREDVSLVSFHALCKRKGWKTGRTGQFNAGQQSWNKGKKMPHNANSAATQFKKGNVAPNTVPLWTEREGKDGYIEMKVPLPNPFAKGQKTRFMHKHRYLWEKENGPVGEGQALKCLDGDRTNCDPPNWVSIPRAMLPRLNSRFGRNYDAAPAEIKPTIMAVTHLEHAIREQSND